MGCISRVHRLSAQFALNYGQVVSRLLLRPARQCIGVGMAVVLHLLRKDLNELGSRLLAGAVCIDSLSPSLDTVAGASTSSDTDISRGRPELNAVVNPSRALRSGV